MTTVLPFIVHSGPAFQELMDPGVRSIIRQQAMKNVAITRKKRKKCAPRPRISHTTRHDCETDTQGSDEDIVPVISSDLREHDKFTAVESLVEATRFGVLSLDNLNPTPSCPSLYESARRRHRVDIAEFALLTHFNIGRGTISALSEDPLRLKTLLSSSQWSYLEFVPRYYGADDCLTTATDCLLQKVKGVLMNDGGEKSYEIELYSKALKSLQTALYDPSKVYTPTVLCATQLLSLHELLSFDRRAAWSSHIQGTEKLFIHRGPERFRGAMDQALFAAHIGQAVFEALFDNKHCYLESPKWIELYRSYISPTDGIEHCLSQFSRLTIDLRCQMIMLPGLWHDVYQAVTLPEFSDAGGRRALGIRCRESHHKFNQWLSDYRTRCESMRHSSPPQEEINMRRELFGVALECLVITKRLLATVCDSERVALEGEARDIARYMIHLQNQPMPQHSWLFSGAEMSVAGSILETTRQWSELVEHQTPMERQERTRARFTAWNVLLRG